MIGIVIVAHGRLAQEYLAAVEHVVGAQSGIQAVPVHADHDRTEKQSEIKDAVDAVDTGDGVAVVVDMFGGSPSNLTMLACEKPNRQIVYGANLPMLVKLAKCRSMPLQKAIDKAVQAGRKYLDCVPSTP